MKCFAARAVGVLLTVLFLTSCTPEEIDGFWKFTEPARSGAEARGLTGERTADLVDCESSGRVDARNGPYRGLFQFDQSTWDGVTERWFPALVGRDPATVEFWWQYAAFWALWAERGGQPWPNC